MKIPEKLDDIFSFIKKISLKLIENNRNTEIRIERQYNLKADEVNVFLLSFDPEVEVHAEELFGVFGFAREDLVPIEATMQETYKRRVIKELGIHLSDEDYRAVVTAATIVRLEDNGRDNDARRTLRKLTERYGERGRRIYNMYRSGVIEYFIYPFLKDLLEELTDLLEVRRKFSEFFEYLIEYNPVMIWVNETTSKKEIIEGLKERFEKYKMPAVHIHARGEENIRTVESAIEEYKKIAPFEFSVDRNDYKLRNRYACTIILTKQ